MTQASAKKLEHTGTAETESVALVPRSDQLASTLEPPLPKRKRNGTACLDHQIEEGKED